MADEEPAIDWSKSRDATHSTYSENTDTESKAEVPPPGPTVIQELGLPTEVAPTDSGESKSKTTKATAS